MYTRKHGVKTVFFWYNESEIYWIGSRILRDNLKNLMNMSIVKYTFPIETTDKHGQITSINKSNLTSNGKDEYCFKGNDNDISKIIYNGIVEFAENEFKIDYDNLDREQTKVIKTKLRYNENDSSLTKLQYGFYGEVLLDLFLRNYFHTDVLIARGYFYSPLEKSEPKGFDAFHIIDNNGSLELWFGEAKFHQSFPSGINSVLSKINYSISDDYLNNHMFAIINEKDNISHSHPILERLIKKWENNPDIILIKELQNNNIELVYPVFIAYQKQKPHSYEKSIASSVDNINRILGKDSLTFSLKIKVSIFVMLLPVDDSNKLKKEVIEWIETKEPLI